MKKSIKRNLKMTVLAILLSLAVAGMLVVPAFARPSDSPWEEIDNPEWRPKKRGAAPAEEKKLPPISEEAKILKAALLHLQGEGDLIVVDTGWVNSYPQYFMKEVEAAGQRGSAVALKFKVKGEDCVVVIPAGAPVNTAVDWSGPDFLRENYADFSENFRQQKTGTLKERVIAAIHA